MKEQRDRERELMELDRDIRTVFAFNLSLKADERDIFELFSKAGSVLDVKIIMDRNTKKSKGFAYIEYQNRVRSCCRAACQITRTWLKRALRAGRHLQRAGPHRPAAAGPGCHGQELGGAVMVVLCTGADCSWPWQV